ncbi:MAG: hypothetical protein LW823_00120 [Rickettsiales bacterium]|nr:hypothetical protein [Rickettsiales bacterium]
MQLILYAIVNIKADDWIVPPSQQSDIPPRIFIIAGIQLLIQHIDHALYMYSAFAVFRELWLALKKSLKFHNRAKPIIREPFQPILDQRGHRFIANHDFPVGALFHFITFWHPHNPITGEHPRTHPVIDLFCVFLAVVLRHAGQQVLDKLAV